MTKHNDNSLVVAALKNSVVSILDGDTTKALTTIAGVIAALNNASPATAPAPTVAKSKAKAPKKAKLNNRLRAEQIAEIKQRLAAGESVATVARTSGLRYQTVYNHRKAALAGK